MRLQGIRDQEALTFIRSFIAEHGYSPTVREVGAALGIRGEGMPFEIISRLEEDGFLRRAPRRSRNIRLNSPLENFATDELHREIERRSLANTSRPTFPMSREAAEPRHTVSAALIQALE